MSPHQDPDSQQGVRPDEQLSDDDLADIDGGCAPSSGNGSVFIPII
jgi:hypothetical protein